MTALINSLETLCFNNPQGSIATRIGRLRILHLVGQQINEAGFFPKSARGLKPRHIKSLITRWKEEGLTSGTIKNRMAAVNWWAKKINKKSIMKSNDDYGIAPRDNDYIDKAQKLNLDKIKNVACPRVKMALRMQAAFGLRREEAMKFSPSIADKGDRLDLKPSWTKGGRFRQIPIVTDRQRDLLDECKTLAGGGSLIPEKSNYKQQMKKYENQTLKAGLKNNHGLRHNYAQWRYHTLTGWKCPLKGGMKKNEMTPEQQAIDEQARIDISEELGHSRIDITHTYLGNNNS